MSGFHIKAVYALVIPGDDTEQTAWLIGKFHKIATGNVVMPNILSVVPQHRKAQALQAFSQGPIANCSADNCVDVRDVSFVEGV